MESDRKQIKILFKRYIQTNDLISLDGLLENKLNMRLLKKEKFLDPFVIAIRSNNLGIFDYLNEKGFRLRGTNLDKNKKLNDGLSPPTSSSSSSSSSSFSNKSPTTSLTSSYSFALVEAVKLSNLEAVNLLISLNIDVSSSNYKYVQPLQIAYNIYSCERDKMLLNAADKDIGKYETSLKILKLLIANKANPNIYNNKGHRILHQVVLDKNLEILELLLSQTNSEPKLKVNSLTYGKMQNSLHLISDQKKLSQMTSSTQRVVANQFEADTSNWTNDKAKLNEINLELAKMLLKAGCNMNHKDYHSHETPAFKAIVANNYDLVKLFVVEGLDMSLRNMFGNDVLSRAIQLGRFKIARLLIAAHSPIRVYSCFFKIPALDEPNRNDSANNDHYVDYGDDDDNNPSQNENFLQYSLQRYEEFLKYLEKYTKEPRSLKDLARLCVRNHMRKPISKWIDQLGVVPKQTIDLIMLSDIEKMTNF